MFPAVRGEGGKKRKEKGRNPAPAGKPGPKKENCGAPAGALRRKAPRGLKKNREGRVASPS